MKLDNVSIRHRIMILIVLPLIGMLVLAGLEASEKLQQKRTADQLATLIELAPAFSALVHELQKERGMSAGFIASGGVNFKDKLPTQRSVTDEKHNALKIALDGADKSEFGDRLLAGIEDSFSRASELAGKRTDVDNRSLTVPQMAKYYTGTIRSFLRVVEEMVVISQNAGSGLNARISAYTQVLQAKERAGVERAMGAAGFGVGQFKPAVYQRFIRLISAQDTYLRPLPNISAPDDLVYLKDTLKGPIVDEVNRLRRIAIESPQTGTTEGVTAPQWFAAITKKINLLKMVEDRFAETVVTKVHDLQSDAKGDLSFLSIKVAVVLVIVIGMSIYIIGSITRPIASLTSEMGQLAGGDLDIVVTGANRGDEIGAMAGAVQVFKENALEVKRLEEQQAATEARAEAQRKAEMNQLADGFESDVGEVVRSVASAVTELKAAAESMTSTADSMQGQTEKVSASSGTAAANVQTVASAAEELSASIGEIRQLVERSAEVAEQTAQSTDSANTKVASLSDSARDIGEVVSLINDIAEQTNLLALNATIEAARAGDAGKGFAVVAAEVKNLAGQTSKATEDISTQVGAIQGATKDAVDAIQSIADSIGEVNGSMSAIQVAVEQQADATQEIARNVEQAAAGTTAVDQSLSTISSAAEETSAATGQIVGAANELSQQSETLASRVGGFVQRVRSENQTA